MKAPKFDYEKQQWDRYEKFHIEDGCFSRFSDGSVAVNYHAHKPYNRRDWPQFGVEFFYPKDPQVSGPGGYRYFTPEGLPVTKKSITEARDGSVDQPLLMLDKSTNKAWAADNSNVLPAWARRGWPRNVIYWPGKGDPMAGAITVRGLRDPGQYPALHGLTAWGVSAAELLPKEKYTQPWERNALHDLLSVLLDCSPDRDAILDFLEHLPKDLDDDGTTGKVIAHYQKNYTAGGPQRFTELHMRLMQSSLVRAKNQFLLPDIVPRTARCIAFEYDQKKGSSIFLTHRERQVPFLYIETK